MLEKGYWRRVAREGLLEKGCWRNVAREGLLEKGYWRRVAGETLLEKGSRVEVKISCGEGVGGSVLGMSAFFTKNQVLAVLSS